MSRRRCHHLLALSALALAGCLQARPEVATSLDAGDYRGLLERRLEAAARTGGFRLRANPVGCACPPFEVEVGGRWLRAAVVEGERDAVEALAAALEATPRATFLVDGELGRELLPCGRAALYVELEANVWRGVEGAPVEAPP